MSVPTRVPRGERRRTALLLAPGAAWLVAFFLAPVAVLMAYSVMPRGIYGGVEPGFTLAAYTRLFDPLYLRILLRTVLTALACTALCLVLGFPVAVAIARSGRWRHRLLFLVVLPLWTSFLVRTYAMIVLLRDGGLINTVLLQLGIIHEPLRLLYTLGAVLAGLVYGYLPLMILPIYASLEKLDLELLEAAATLGARPLSRLRRVTLPLAAPGIIAGCVLVFVPALGAFLTPDLLGGARTVMVGNLIQNQFSAARDWPFGAATSIVIMASVLLTVRLLTRRGAVT